MMRTFLMIFVVALVTVLIRFLPFIIFDGKRETPQIVFRLEQVLPYAIMGMLAVYCLKDISFLSIPDWVPKIIASAITVLSYVLKRNTLLSIAGGTICYMFLVQMVF